ncbi:MAG: response regulator [Magnetococcales bacterium]|nr:response regulator [Magnetococcales bacterium]
MTRPGDEPVLTASQTAKMFGVAVQTVHQWVEKGLLEAWRTPGGHRRILKKSVLSLLEQRVGNSDKSSTPNPFHLLVVEDDARMAMTYKMHLKKWNFPMQVDSAASGVEALIQVAKRRPNMIITDLVMPDLDGFRMIKELRKDPEMQSIHLIVITILEARDIQARGGIPDDVMVLQKPVQFPWLKEIVRQQITLLEQAARKNDYQK